MLVYIERYVSIERDAQLHNKSQYKPILPI